jgi:hypothetical protein
MAPCQSRLNFIGAVTTASEYVSKPCHLLSRRTLDSSNPVPTNKVLFEKWLYVHGFSDGVLIDERDQMCSFAPKYSIPPDALA